MKYELNHRSQDLGPVDRTDLWYFPFATPGSHDRATSPNEIAVVGLSFYELMAPLFALI
jgi:hypothetical protein